MSNIESLWSKTAPRPSFAPLHGDVKTDVLIIGGGITGILCAYMLKKAGVDCVLAEADRICGGVTQNTTAKITLLHGLLYDSLIRKFGFDTAQRYLHAQQDALQQYRTLCDRFSCDYEQQTAYTYSLRDREKLECEVQALDRLGCPAAFTETTSLPFAVKGAVSVADQARFHPLKFAFAMAQDLPVYEQTKVLELGPHRAVTPHGSIVFRKCVVATHFPLLNKHGGYFLKLYQHRSYVLALRGVPPVEGMYVDENPDGLSFRMHDGSLLLGGGSHRTGKTGGAWRELETFARRWYDSPTVSARWATQDCMTLDGIPYIGPYSRRLENIYVATGYNKWGMTAAMVAARILTDAVQGRQNDYAAVFSPARSVWHRQLALNAAESVIGLLTPARPRCPHMGCALKYNAQEHSWDCPCHGSRFAEDGTLINNPATDDKKNMPEP